MEQILPYPELMRNFIRRTLKRKAAEPEIDEERLTASGIACAEDTDSLTLSLDRLQSSQAAS